MIQAQHLCYGVEKAKQTKKQKIVVSVVAVYSLTPRRKPIHKAIHEPFPPLIEMSTPHATSQQR